MRVGTLGRMVNIITGEINTGKTTKLLLELQFKGFYSIFFRSLSGCKDIYFTVRTSIIDDVIIVFGIKGYNICKIT